MNFHSILPNQVSNGLHNYTRDTLIKIKLHTQGVFLNLFSCRAAAQRGPCLLIYDVSRPHTKTNHSQRHSSGQVISLSQRPSPDNTTPQPKNIHSPGRIRTRTAGEWPQPTPYTARPLRPKGVSNHSSLIRGHFYAHRERVCLKVQVKSCTSHAGIKKRTDI
jgi:hypothetical protein